MLKTSHTQPLPPALRTLYESAEGRNVSTLAVPSPPRIGLTCHTSEMGYSVHPAYIQAIEAAGGIPILLPTLKGSNKLLPLLENIDGLLLTGGGDIHPSFLGEEPIPELRKVDLSRDKYELELILFAYRRNIPMLGICRGFQMLNVALGGTLMQDLYKDHPSLEPSLYKRLASPINHDPQIDKQEGAHSVMFAKGTSFLAEIMGHSPGESIWVNSLHHQAIRRLAPELHLEATAPDGIIEAATAYPERPIMGVQWHPEHMALGGNREMKALFSFFVQEASLFAQAKALHSKAVVLDSHTDTPMFLTAESTLTERGEQQVDAVKMLEGKVAASVMVAYLPQGDRSPEALQRAQEYALEKLETIREIVAKSELLHYSTSSEEIIKAQQKGLLSIIPAIENGYALGNSLAILEDFKRMGVVYITLCHNGDNDICDSANRSLREHQGLSEFGRKVIGKMNELGILIDISHASDETIDDVLQISTHPVIASHSSCRALCPHRRNLTDEQISRIAHSRGVVQVCLYTDFITSSGCLGTVQEAANHIDHIVSLVGYEYVGIGSDFDGGGDLKGCHGSNDLINLTVELLRRGYNEKELTAILGGNFLRVMKSVGR